MAAPSTGSTLESYIPVVQYRGLNTNKAVNFSGFAVDTSGNVTLDTGDTFNMSGTFTNTGAMAPTGGVGPAGGFSISPRTIWSGNVAPIALTTGTDTAFVTTETSITETFIPANCTVTGVAVLMGTAAGNGNIAVALANSSGVVVASSASTTTSGTSTTFTQVAFSSTYAAKGPATYYVLVQGANTSDKTRLLAAGNFGASVKTSETYGTFTTVTPPTTFTAAKGTISSLY